MSEENITPKKRPGLKKGAKVATKAEVQERILEVYRALKDFKSRTDIRKKFSEEWGITTRQVDKYVAKAYALLKEDWDVDRVDMSCRIFGAYEKILQKGMQTNQLNAALGALAGMTRLGRMDPSSDSKR